MTIAYEELHGYPQAGISNGRFSGVRKFRVAWADWPEFYGQLVGTYQNTSGGVIITLPSKFPGVNYTYVTNVDVEGIGKITSGTQSSLAFDLNEYTYADMTCTYSFLPPPDTNISGTPTIPGGTILTYSSNLGVEYLTIPGRKLEWTFNSEALPDDSPVGLRIPTEDLQLSFMHVPMIPSALRKLRGKTNDAMFMGYSSECVLFDGASISREFQLVTPPNTPAMYRIDYHFSVKANLDGVTPRGWNNFYRPEGDGGGNYWLAVRTRTTNQKPFPTADFSTLFTLT